MWQRDLIQRQQAQHSMTDQKSRAHPEARLSSLSPFATVAELARELGYTRNRLRRLLTALERVQTIPLFSIQVGNRRLYRRADIRRLLADDPRSATL